MFIEKKFDYHASREGKFFANEANAIVDEILTVIRVATSPIRTKVNQLLYSISIITTFVLWRASEVFNVDGTRHYIIHRKNLLPEPDEYISGMSGDLRFNVRCEQDAVKIGFKDLSPLNVRMFDAPAEPSHISTSNIYKWELRQDEDTMEMYFDIIPILGEQVIVSDNTPKMVTCEPAIIHNNSFTVDVPIASAIVFNTAHVYTVDSNGNRSLDYDTKRCFVDPNDDKKVIIYDDDDNIDLNGSYAVISYGG